MEVGKGLAGCQAVELALKRYISHAFRNIRGLVGAKYTFKFSGKDYDESFLERLIEVFNKLCSNSGLVKRLNQFKKDRNFLAHQVAAKQMDDDGNLDEWEIAGTHDRINAIQRDARSLLDEILKEHSKLWQIYTGIPVPPPKSGDVDAG